MTETELQELGISRNLWNEWQETMNALWSMARTKFNGVENVTNTIVIGKWIIKANFVNGKFIEVVAEKDEEERISVRLKNNLPVVVHSIYLLIKFDYTRTF